MPLTFQCTEFAVVNGRRKVVRSTPYKRISRDGQAIFIQNGQVFGPGGERLNELPDWFDEEMAKQSKAGLDAVGWVEHKKVGRPPSKETVEKRLAAKEDA